MFKYFAVLLAMAVTVAAPFALRPRDSGAKASTDNTVIVITPHSESIRQEFGRAFEKHMRETQNRTVQVEWRTPGGTSEISKIIQTNYYAAFRNYWKQDLKRPWSDKQIGENFNNRLEPDDTPADDTSAEAARRAFLESEVGIGLDIFFGGGAYDFQKQAAQGHLIDSGVAEREPDWFTGEIIPAEVSGEPMYDPEFRWLGACLSSFGIVSNLDALARCGIDAPLDRWDQLADPRLFGQIALADPTKSGSTTKAFEMLIQEQIALAGGTDTATNEIPDPEAIAAGWLNSLKLIQKIAANARYFTDSSGKIPLDVAQGNAAAGMCIDFYGRTFNERHREPGGSSRVLYITPVGGSSTGADPIGMFRGAPHPELAREFIHFVLSKDGQKVWDYRAGVPGGPTVYALRRLPIRKDLYTDEFLPYFSDPEVMPYDNADAFHYVPDWTSSIFGSIRLTLQVMCLEPHPEMAEAWEALIAAEFPPEAMAAFHNLEAVTYDRVEGPINDVVRSTDKLAVIDLARHLRENFRANYRLAKELAEAGK